MPFSSFPFSPPCLGFLRRRQKKDKKKKTEGDDGDSTKELGSEGEADVSDHSQLFGECLFHSPDKFASQHVVLNILFVLVLF